jgi:putative aldouronate transport system substrate-binding protein
MKKVKAFLSIVFAVILLFSIVGCESDKASTQKVNNDTKNAAKDVKTTPFSIWTWLGAVEVWGGKSYDEVLAYQEMKKRTGVDVKYVHPTGDAVEAFNLMMTSGKMEDAIWYNWKPERALQYYNAGRILDIYPLVKQYAPNLYKLIESNKELKKQVVDPDGKMYYMPWITLDKYLNQSEGLALRADWLEKVGSGVPKNNEELYDVLKKMKDQKVSGDKKFVGLTGYSPQIYKLFYGFGVADDWYLEGKKVAYGPASDRYKEALKWYNKLYKEGLLDKDFLTNEGDIYDKHLVDGQSAGFIDNSDSVSRIMKLAADSGNAFSLKPIPYMEYKGKPTSLNSTAKRVAQPYGLAIAATAKNPEGIIKYLDYGFSKEGEELFNWGIKGDTFEEKDGKKIFTDKIMKDPKDVPGLAATKYTNSAWITSTSVEATKAVLDSTGVEARDIWSNVDLSMAFEPILWMTQEENDIINGASTDIATYKDSMRDAFVTGQKDVDKEWDNYIKTLKSMGIENIQKAKQSAYDRYNKK